MIHTQRMLASKLQMIVDCLPFLAEEPPVLVELAAWTITFGGNQTMARPVQRRRLYIDEGQPVPQLIGETLRNCARIAADRYSTCPGFEEIALALPGRGALRRIFSAA